MLFIKKRLVFTGFFLFALTADLLSQEALNVTVDKPEKFENKKLGYEKTGEKKFSIPRRFMSNTTTHYNYFFNANNKLNEVVARAKAGNRDNFTELLPFYNYSLEQTAQEKQELDSVIFKVTTGILIHDLRNNWLDDLYLLLGKAFYFRNDLDSAWQTFQYINYAFSPKESDGYDKVIGSNSNEDGNALSISTKEDRTLVKKMFTSPPVRNESFIWQIRTYIQRNQLAEAAGLIETLRNDPLFPSRLETELNEVQAFWYYRQNMFDSSAKYLELALENAESGNELARWEYLIGQMQERAGDHENAEKYFARAIRHTYDPVLEVYARLNSLRQSEGGSNEKNIQVSIDELIKMARKDKYFNYRDLIYFTAAQMELDRKNYPAAISLLKKSVHFSSNNAQQKSQAFLALGDLAFSQKDFVSAKNYYDSVNVNETLITDLGAFNARKQALSNIVFPSGVVYRQDSLQKIASMPEKDREVYVRKLVKQLRKLQGLKDEEIINPVQNNFANQSSLPLDLFNNVDKSVWYFDNAAQRAKGYNEFRIKWGNRPNVDNWRRIAAVTQFAQAKITDNRIGDVPPFTSGSTELSYDALIGRLPTTVERLKASNDSVEVAMMQLGRAYQDDLEEYQLAIDTYEKLLERYPTTHSKQDAYFSLYYSYWKLKNQPKADYYRNLLEQQFPAGKYDNALHPEHVQMEADSILKRATTSAYEQVYTLFIEGNFNEAISAKRSLDSMYGRKFWTPQLSYIEALYYIRQRNDSTAKLLLSDIMYRFSETLMAEKAKTMLDVLNRRKEIEDYLTNLSVERRPEDTLVVREEPAITKNPAKVITSGNRPVTDSAKTVMVPKQIKADTTQKVVNVPPATKSVYSFDPAKPQFILIVLDRVDPVYVTETRNAFNRYNREKYYNKVIDIVNVPLDDNIKLVVMSNFANLSEAVEYVNKVKAIAGGEIVPWLPRDKYSFSIISAENLELLKTSKDLKGYREALNLAFPGML